MSLSKRLRPGIECAQWVIDEVAAMETELAHRNIEIEDLEAVNKLRSDLLAKICLALKGPDSGMGLHSWHDLPELVKKLKESGQ